MGCGTSKLRKKSAKKLRLNSISSSSHLFVDPDFQARFDLPQGLSRENNVPLHKSISWVRPHQMVSQPELYVDGTSRRDVIQGILGDCWLLSTCAALAKKEDLLHRVLAPDQPLYGPGYTGQLKVRLWQFGEWQEVIIDDFLPVLNGKYVYSHCDDPSEFWVAFIEKAFAKLYGSYEALEGGMPIESMVDLTGGLAERYQLSEWQMLETLYDYIRRSFSENAFITCSRKGDWRRAHASDVNGLVQGHAYTITGIYRLFVDNAMFCLVRIRNPWGDNNEWKGDWSDKFEKWRDVDEDTKRKIGLQNKADGEFWMDFFTDFVSEFEEVSICTMGPDFDKDGQVDNALSTLTHHGAWIPGKNAGGCRNDFALFAANPKIKITVKHPTNQLIVSLAQKRIPKAKLHQIGFSIYKALDNNDDGYDEAFFMAHKAIGTSGPYINYREIFGRFSLTEGVFIIVPATFEPDTPSVFLLRIFSQERITLSEIK